MERAGFLLILPASLALVGCAASIAASAVGAAINASRPGETNEDLRGAATTACTARAAPHGEVHIIDASQRSGGRVIVWGTVTAGVQRQAFQCSWRSQVRDFDLRPLPPRQETTGAQPS